MPLVEVALGPFRYQCGTGVGDGVGRKTK